MTSPYRRPSPVVAIMMTMYLNSVTAIVGPPDNFLRCLSITKSDTPVSQRFHISVKRSRPQSYLRGDRISQISVVAGFAR